MLRIIKFGCKGERPVCKQVLNANCFHHNAQLTKGGIRKYATHHSIIQRGQRPKSAVEQLAIPLAFTAGVCGVSYLYTRWSKPPVPGSRLFPQLKPSHATLAVIIAMNGGVFLAWRLPQLASVMGRYGVLDPARLRLPTLLTSAFSHMETAHLLINMLALWNIGGAVHDLIGRQNFLAFYVSSAAVSSFGSLAWQVLSRRPLRPSLGASGAILGCLGFVGYVLPKYGFKRPLLT